jgi:hypothetical protein
MGRFREVSAQADRERAWWHRESERVAPAWFMVCVNSAGSAYVKELDFFHEQGGFRQAWGKHWVPVVANNLEHARRRACELPGARPWAQQAKP